MAVVALSPAGDGRAATVAPAPAVSASPGVVDLRSAFGRTEFVAALDATAGKSWPTSCILDHDPCQGVLATQRRRVDGQLALLGLHPELASPLRDGIREVLGLDGVAFGEAARVLAGEPASLRRRGEAICHVLLELDTGERLSRKLAVTGFLAGRWGRPYRWDAAARTLHPLGLPFSDLGTVAPRPPP